VQQNNLSTIAADCNRRRRRGCLEATGDPDDNMFLECAGTARADYLITGNQKLFPRFWKKTNIITPREFINLVAPHLIK